MIVKSVTKPKSRSRFRLPIETIVAVVAALTLLPSTPAEAGDGVCVSTYTRHFPAAANQFYATGDYVSYSTKGSLHSQPYHLGSWEKGSQPPLPYTYTYPTGQTYTFKASDLIISESIRPKAFPTAYRSNFTSPTKAEVWTVPAMENSFWWYVTSNRTLAGHPAAPVYSGTFTGGALAGYTQAERDAGLYPGWYTESHMKTDSETGAYTLGFHIDPQQFATRFVIKDVYSKYLTSFSYGYSPDINVPDSTVLSAATANAAKLTQATIDRLRGYIDNGNVQRNYLDLNSSAIIHNDGYSGLIGGDFAKSSYGPDEFAGCGLFAEIVKHPRLQNVYMLKYFIRSATITGLAPFNRTPNAGTFIAYAPYLLGPAYTAPTLNPDSASGMANEKVEIKPLNNDTAGSTGTLTLTGVSNPAHGSVTWTGGNVSYMPAFGFSGMDSMTYTVTDGVSSYSSTISIEIKLIPPKLNPDSVSGPANEEVEIKPLDNDTVGSTGTLTLVGVSTPAHGTVTWNGNNVTYMPGEDFSGMDTMVYTVTDGVSNYSSTISVQIQSVPPKLNPDTVITGHTVPVTFNVLANDTDPDGPNPLRVASVEQPEHGSISWNANGSVTFYPENSFIGTFTASYTATDGISTSSSYIVFTTIQCFKDVWHDAGLQCDSRNPQGSADFAASCEYSPAGYDQEEIACPAN